MRGAFVNSYFVPSLTVINFRNMQKCQEKITDMEEEIEKMKEDLLKMKANKENIAAESKEMMEQKSAIGVSIFSLMIYSQP